MTNLQKYQIISSYDRERIKRELAVETDNLGDVHRLQSEAFAALSPGEVQMSRDNLVAQGLGDMLSA